MFVVNCRLAAIIIQCSWESRTLPRKFCRGTDKTNILSIISAKYHNNISVIPVCLWTELTYQIRQKSEHITEKISKWIIQKPFTIILKLIYVAQLLAVMYMLSPWANSTSSCWCSQNWSWTEIYTSPLISLHSL